MEWFECEPQKLATGAILRSWLRTEYLNGMVTTADSVIYRALWSVGEDANAYMVRREYMSLEMAQRAVSDAVPDGARRQMKLRSI